jgi:hypothetical protein
VRLRIVLMGAVLLLVVAVTAVILATRYGQHLPLPAVLRACEARTPAGAVKLSDDQMANAATIAAIGIRRSLPDRAIMVALAAALQESQLRNLTGGDRDSVGLFQQRPSQGWGTREQLRDPRYAAKKFYDALLRVRGWQEMRVTEAAQRVQRSAYPEAYERWTTDSAVLAEALAGRVTGAVTCTHAGAPTHRGQAARESLDTGLQLDWGTSANVSGTDLSVAVSARDQQAGWQLAHWIVAHSAAHGVERVRFSNQQWSADTGAWRSMSDTDGTSSQVLAEVYRP